MMCTCGAERVLTERGVCVLHTALCVPHETQWHPHTHTHTCLLSYKLRAPGKSCSGHYGWACELPICLKSLFWPLLNDFENGEMLPAVLHSAHTRSHSPLFMVGRADRWIAKSLIKPDPFFFFIFINENAFLCLFGVTVWRHRRPVHSCRIIQLSKSVNLQSEKYKFRDWIISTFSGSSSSHAYYLMSFPFINLLQLSHVLDIKPVVSHMDKFHTVAVSGWYMFCSYI